MDEPIEITLYVTRAYNIHSKFYTSSATNRFFSHFLCVRSSLLCSLFGQAFEAAVRKTKARAEFRYFDNNCKSLVVLRLRMVFLPNAFYSMRPHSLHFRYRIASRRYAQSVRGFVCFAFLNPILCRPAYTKKLFHSRVLYTLPLTRV